MEEHSCRLCGRILCGTASLTCLMGCLFVAVRGSERAVIGNQSLASAAILVTLGLTTLLLLSLTCASSQRWQSIILLGRRWTASPVTGGSHRLFWWVLAIGLCCQFSLHLRCYVGNHLPVEDQGDYLRVAHDIHSHYGPARLLTHGLLGGQFTEANRHPLYVVLLSLSPTLALGKSLSIFFSLALTTATACIALHGYGPRVASWTVALLSTNLALLLNGSIVACESLLAVLFFFAWNRLHKPALELKDALVAGIWIGLAYLTKSSAFFVFAATGLAVSIDGRNGSRRFELGCALAIGFLVMASPLLIRNSLAYHNPLYSYNNQFLFADDFDSGLQQPDLGFRGNLDRYLQSHTGADIASRFFGGIATQLFVLCRTLGPTPLDTARFLVGAVWIGLLLAEMASCWNYTFHRMLLITLVVFLLFFAWYGPIATSDRFYVPILGPMVVTATVGLIRTFQLFGVLEKTVDRFALVWIIFWTVAGQVCFESQQLFVVQEL